MVKGKRILDDKEKSICERNIKARTLDVDWLKYQIKYHELMIEGKGLYLNYLRKESEFKLLKKELSAELKINEEVVEELRKQIKEGVEILDIKEVSDGDKTDSFKKYC